MSDNVNIIRRTPIGERPDAERFAEQFSKLGTAIGAGIAGHFEAKKKAKIIEEENKFWEGRGANLRGVAPENRKGFIDHLQKLEENDKKFSQEIMKENLKNSISKQQDDYITHGFTSNPESPEDQESPDEPQQPTKVLSAENYRTMANRANKVGSKEKAKYFSDQADRIEKKASEEKKASQEKEKEIEHYQSLRSNLKRLKELQPYVGNPLGRVESALGMIGQGTSSTPWSVGGVVGTLASFVSPHNRKTPQAKAEIESLIVPIIQIAREMDSKGTLAKGIFAELLKRIPDPDNTESEYSGHLAAWEKILDSLAGKTILDEIKKREADSQESQSADNDFVTMTKDGEVFDIPRKDADKAMKAGYMQK